MACTSEKREVDGCMKDARTVAVPAKRETGGSCAVIAIIGLGGIIAVAVTSVATIAQALA